MIDPQLSKKPASRKLCGHFRFIEGTVPPAILDTEILAEFLEQPCGLTR